MSDLVLCAPVSGWLAPLDEVPDPVFADRIMGDGVAIDPTEGSIRAPADAVVVSIPETGHAVSLRLANGAELLIHVGLETVALGGEGFRPRVKAGDAVRQGDSLIEFDLDLVARKAKSLITPMVLTSEGTTIRIERPGRLVAAGDRIGAVSSAAGPNAPLTAANGGVHRRTVELLAANGIHARPAARLVALVKTFDAAVTLSVDGRSADARSTVGLLALGAKRGAALAVEGRGPDAQAAVEAAAAFIASGMGEDSQVAASAGQAARAEPAHPEGAGVCAVAGLAIGRIMQLRASDLTVPRNGNGTAAETDALDQAILAVEHALSHQAGAGELADAHIAMLRDPSLLSRARQEIGEGRSAAQAWRTASAEARQMIAATGDPLLAERQADLLDLERRVLAELVGEAAHVPDLPQDTILVAEDLLPSQFLALDRTRIAGICTAAGGPTSHVAVLAASADIPMLVAVGADVLSLADGTLAILDPAAGVIEPDPSQARLDEFRALLVRRTAMRAADSGAAHEDCRTSDGMRIEVFANLGSAADAANAVAAGAEGCGLLRTEFLFLDRDTPPDEEEQFAIYAEIAAILDERPLVVRTLDIGGDKPVPYLPTQHEDNPALGCRGIRLGLARTDMLETQFRAILRAVPGDRCQIMLPMVVDVDEYRGAKALLDRAAAAVGREGAVSLGVMVETPAAAMLADTIAAEADFLSVGTNDLTQYALACDRGNPAVSAKVDGFHPAVLRLIRSAGEGASRHRRWFGVCGGMASDPLAVPILLGLGVTEFSVTPAVLPTIKARIRGLDIEACRRLAERACAASTAAEVRAIAQEASA